jgi:hypothetical protein
MGYATQSTLEAGQIRAQSFKSRGNAMTALGHSCRFGIGRESAHPHIPDILGARFIRRCANNRQAWRAKLGAQPCIRWPSHRIA